MADDLTTSHLGCALKSRDTPGAGFEPWCLTVKLSGGLADLLSGTAIRRVYHDHNGLGGMYDVLGLGTVIEHEGTYTDLHAYAVQMGRHIDRCGVRQLRSMCDT